MAQELDVHVSYNEVEEIMRELKQRKLYSPDSLYRVLTIKDNISPRVREILRRGTDRTSDEILGTREEGYFNLMEEDDIKLQKRRRPLKPSEYLWLVEEKELQEQISHLPSKGHIFVSIYDEKKMISVNGGLCYEFRDKNRPKDALVALVRLHYR